MKTLHLKQFTTAKAGRPFAINAVNAVGRLLPSYKRPSADAWWDAAINRVEGSEPTGAAQEAMRQLVAALNTSAHLNLTGKFGSADDTMRMARTHLRIQKLLGERPEILNTALPPPIYIIGLPRTGSTFLHQLLAQDPRHRHIPYWESFDPVPPQSRIEQGAGANDTYDKSDRRREKLNKMLAQVDSIAPNYDAIHAMTAESPEECVAFFMNELRTLQYDMQYNAPGYVEWLQAQDASIAYEGYKRQLQIAQYFQPHGERLLLKDPTHCGNLETILALFPDAQFVFIHRDPTESISSLCSLYAYTRAMFSDNVKPDAIGTEVLSGHWPSMLASAMRVRDKLEPSQFTDVLQSTLADNPLAAVASIYRALGITFDDIAQAKMQEFLAVRAAEPKHVHEHSLEGFGLSSEGVRGAFSDYVEQFCL